MNEKEKKLAQALMQLQKLAAILDIQVEKVTIRPSNYGYKTAELDFPPDRFLGVDLNPYKDILP